MTFIGQKCRLYYVRAPRMSILERLVNQKIINGEANEEAVGPVLTDAVLAVYNPMNGATPSECVGTIIKAV